MHCVFYVGRNNIALRTRFEKPDSTSLRRSFAFIGAYAVAAGIMGIVWVLLLLLLIDPGWTLLKQALVIVGLTSAFSVYLLLAYKIFRLFGSMFGELQK